MSDREKDTDCDDDSDEWDTVGTEASALGRALDAAAAADQDDPRIAEPQ